MANDLLSALRTYLSKVSSGEKTPQEMAAALNAWARESGESIKVRVEEEVARTVKKMGFAKQEEVDRLARELEVIKSKLVLQPNRTENKKSAKTPNSAAKANNAKISSNKKSSTAVKPKTSKSATKPTRSSTKSSNKSSTIKGGK